MPNEIGLTGKKIYLSKLLLVPMQIFPLKIPISSIFSSMFTEVSFLGFSWTPSNLVSVITQGERDIPI